MFPREQEREHYALNMRACQRKSNNRNVFLNQRAIGIGGSLTAPPLPHHRAYGSVHGGSTDLSGWAASDRGMAKPVEEGVR